MRAKFIFEKYKEESDPIADMKIGFNLRQYTSNQLNKYEIPINYFNKALAEYIQRMTTPEDFIELFYDILKHTPVEYQKEKIDEFIIDFLEGEEIDTKNYNNI